MMEGEDISLKDVDNKEEKEEEAPNATELQKSTQLQFLGDDEDSKKEEKKNRRRRRKNEQ
jgi:hypothetical protein